MAYGEGLIARGKHWLVFGKKTNQSPTLKGRERILQNQVLMSNWLFFDNVTTSLDDWIDKQKTSVSENFLKFVQIYLSIRFFLSVFSDCQTTP